MNDISDAQCALKKKQQEIEENLTHSTETEIDTARIKLILFWSLVGIPLFWGVTQTLDKAMQLFK